MQMRARVFALKTFCFLYIKILTLELSNGVRYLYLQLLAPARLNFSHTSKNI